MMHLCLLLLLAGTVLLQSPVVNMESTSSTLYKYNISGILYCSENGQTTPMPNSYIYLKEDDGAYILNDDLGETITDEEGHFEGLVGEEDEGDPAEPFIHIPRHKCTDSWWRNAGTTNVWLTATPERQNLTIYLGKNVAILHREGQEDLQLEVTWQHNRYG